MISVLLVDDDPDLLEIINLELGSETDFIVTVCASPAKAIEIARVQQFDAIVCDFSMPGMNGLALVRLLRARGCSARFILYSAKEKDDEIADALTHGLDVYLPRKGNPESEFRRLKQFIRTADPLKKPGSSVPED